MLLRGEVSRVAKGADCKSAASWLRRFESFLPHQPSLAKRPKAATPKSTAKAGCWARELRLGEPSIFAREATKAAPPKPTAKAGCWARELRLGEPSIFAPEAAKAAPPKPPGKGGC